MSRSWIAWSLDSMASLPQLERFCLEVLSANSRILVSVDQANYFANMTMHNEALPVTADIIAVKGCDLMVV